MRVISCCLASAALVLACLPPRPTPLETADAAAPPHLPEQREGGAPPDDEPAEPADAAADPGRAMGTDAAAGCSVSGCPGLPNANVRCVNDRCEYTCNVSSHRKCADGCWACCQDQDCAAPANPDRTLRCISNRCEEACQAITCAGTPARCLPRTGLCLSAFHTPEPYAGCAPMINICSNPIISCDPGVDLRTSTKVYGPGDSLEQLCAADHVASAKEICATNATIRQLRSAGMEAGVILSAYTFNNGGTVSARIAVGTYLCP